jgi:hypothetical protein
MEEAEARTVVNDLLNPASKRLDDRWKDPLNVATVDWREGALDSIADPELGASGTALVELELSSPHPNFYGIVRTDGRGIWYSDADGSPQEAVWRLRLIPWGHVKGITLHQVS